MDLKTKLLELALKARSHAYAPYSGFQVGAAIAMEDGSIYGGCNVENASYGGTICAERVAVTKAVSESKSRRVTEILVVTDAAQAWPPCGFCRQVLAEFAAPDCPVHTANLVGIQKTYKLKDLLPEAFTGRFLAVEQKS